MKEYCIYIIENSLNGKIYVGSAKNFRTRKNMHLYKLRHRIHHSIHLQRVYDKYDEDIFFFSIREDIDSEDKDYILSREQYWIDYYDSSNPEKGYNICPTAGSRMGAYHSEEVRAKICKSKKGQRAGIKPDNFIEMQKKMWKTVDIYENDTLIISFPNIKQCGIFLNVDYRLIHNIKNGKCKKLRKYPNYEFRFKAHSSI